MSPQDAVDGWDDVVNAEQYSAFARSHTMYARTSQDLVDRAGIRASSMVVDLCGGTGVTAATVLARLGPAGRVHSLDLSAAMQAVGRREVSDDRVTWTTARAEDVAALVDSPADAVVCNSAIWKTDVAATVRGVRRVLRPGGRFVFNIGGGFAGLPKTPSAGSGPSLNVLIHQIAVEQFGYRPQRHSGHHPTMSEDRLRDQLQRAGMRMVAAHHVVHVAPVLEKRDWLSIPVFARPADFGDHATRMQILGLAWQRVDHRATYTTDWLVVTAA